jgi:predicted Zn-dependent peptidase
VMGLYEGPPPNANDFMAFRMATSWLSYMITDAVREKRGLSYAASASLAEGELVTGMLYASTPRPDTVVRLMLRQVATLTNPDSIPPGGIIRLDNNSLSRLFRRATSADQVASLAEAELLLGDYRMADNVPRNRRAVTTSEIRLAARKYMTNIRFVYAGDTTKITRKAFERPNW